MTAEAQNEGPSEFLAILDGLYTHRAILDAEDKKTDAASEYVQSEQITIEDGGVVEVTRVMKEAGEQGEPQYTAFVMRDGITFAVVFDVNGSVASAKFQAGEGDLADKEVDPNGEFGGDVREVVALIENAVRLKANEVAAEVAARQARVREYFDRLLNRKSQ